MPHQELRDDPIVDAIHGLITQCGATPDTYSRDLATQMIQTALKMLIESHDLGQMKLLSRALKEMRYAYRIFSKFPNVRRISIFGSARTPEKHPDYKAAKSFSMGMAKEGWMCITGAAEGIMRASIIGAQLKSSFGLSICLPWETPANSLIKGDFKHIMFRYFFTRKLMFTSHADAVAAFPGGYGTLDELFEVLTLMQTGKSGIIPVVLIEGKNGNYWKKWKHYVDEQLCDNRWISPEDQNLYYIAKSPADAKKHILRFYHSYHSSRYVNELLVIRLQKPLSSKQLDELNEVFLELVASGKMYMRDALPEENSSEDLKYKELPRLVFHHTRKDFGLLRRLIDRLNAMKL